MNQAASPNPYRQAYFLLAGLFLLVILIDLGFIAWRKTPVGDLPVNRARTVELFAPLDPNTAAVEDLQTIPGLSEKNAKAIFNYRQAFKNQFPGHTAFTCPQDLDSVKGIGEKTIRRIEKNLTFPKPGQP